MFVSLSLDKMIIIVKLHLSINESVYPLICLSILLYGGSLKC